MADQAAGEKVYPLGPEENYEVALKVDCPFCGVKVGERCAPHLIFPQYPHTDRVNKSLKELNGWTEEEIQKEFDFGV